MLTTGTKGKAEVKVDDTNTAVTMGSGSLKVFATPAMIALYRKRLPARRLKDSLRTDRPLSAQSWMLHTLPLLPSV